MNSDLFVFKHIETCTLINQFIVTDEIIPVDSKSTPIMDEDYEDEECEEEEEEYPEVGAEESLEGEEDTASSVRFIFYFSNNL